MPVEPALRTGVGVIVVGDIAHVIIDVMLKIEKLFDHRAELRLHVLHVILRRFDPVMAPHDHRRRANLTLGNPADVVFVKPLSDLGRFAEIT